MADLDYVFTGEPVEADAPGAGVRIHYIDWGPAPGPAFVFLHGGGLNAHTWDVVCDLLRRDFRCLAIDLRGHGDSDWDPRGDYSLEAHLTDLGAVVDALALDQFALVGMSLGGIVALDYTATNPDHVAGLVLVDTGPTGSRGAGRRRLGEFMEGPREFKTIDELIDRAIRFNPRRSRERLRKTLLKNLRRTPQGTWTWKYDQRILRLGQRPELTEEAVQQHLEERSRRLWRDVELVSCPTLVVRGGDSDMFLDEDAERTATAFADGRWLRIEGASHTVQSDRPQELAEALRVFGLSLDLASEEQLPER